MASTPRGPGPLKLDEQFKQLRNDLEEWAETSVILEAASLGTTEMRSAKHRRQIADEINHWQNMMVDELIHRLLNNQLGQAPAVLLKGLRGSPNVNLNALPLGEKYMQRKAHGSKKRQIPARPRYSFFLYTGALAQALRVELPLALQHFGPEHVHPLRKATTEHTRYKKRDKEGNIIGYRVQENFKDHRGRFARATVELNWNIEVLHKAFYLFQQPELVMNLEEDTVLKLINYQGKRRGVYRPLLGPYLNWFARTAIRDIIEKHFGG